MSMGADEWATTGRQATKTQKKGEASSASPLPCRRWVLGQPTSLLTTDDVSLSAPWLLNALIAK